MRGGQVSDGVFHRRRRDPEFDMCGLYSSLLIF